MDEKKVEKFRPHNDTSESGRAARNDQEKRKRNRLVQQKAKSNRQIQETEDASSRPSSQVGNFFNRSSENRRSISHVKPDADEAARRKGVKGA